MKRLSRLNAKGIAHDALLVVFVAVFAIGGVGYMVASHADASKRGATSHHPKKKIAKKKVNKANPNNCTIAAAKTSNPQKNTRGQLVDYFQNDLNGKVYKSHYLTFKRDDKTMAKKGFCYVGKVGFAYAATSDANKGVPLYQFYNASTHHYLYSVNAADPAATTGYVKQSTLAVVSASFVPGTDMGQVVRMVNAGTGTNGGIHYFFTANLKAVANAQTKNHYTQDKAATPFFIWKTSKEATPAAPAAPSGDNEATDNGSGDENGQSADNSGGTDGTGSSDGSGDTASSGGSTDGGSGDGSGGSTDGGQTN